MTRDTDGKNERLKSLAELAFRMRDELHYVIGNAAWDRACWEVWRHEMKQQNSDIFERKSLSLDRREMFCWNWMATWASPIHWIIAALITKEIETNPEEKFDDHLASEYKMEGVRMGRMASADLPEIRVVKYAIGQDEGGAYGMWDGPNPSLKEMLDVEGRDGNSVLIRFNADGTDEEIYRWTCGEWMKVIHVVEGIDE